MTTAPNGYQPILELCDQIQKSQDADALMAALVMVYVGIDTMAWLSLPIGSSSVNRSCFCAWVDTYLKTDASHNVTNMSALMCTPPAAPCFTVMAVWPICTTNRTHLRYLVIWIKDRIARMDPP
jgi:hypothetical protein